MGLEYYMGQRDARPPAVAGGRGPSAVLAGGGAEGMAPVRLGDVAYISFVRDPDGNWLEISQRKSITGSLD